MEKAARLTLNCITVVGPEALGDAQKKKALDGGRGGNSPRDTVPPKTSILTIAIQPHRLAGKSKLRTKEAQSPGRKSGNKREAPSTQRFLGPSGTCNLWESRETRCSGTKNTERLAGDRAAQ